ncbi:winged helix-turn-helix transcriptional regulator [Rhizobium sp. ARZ01]|uniref:ArsR/SmtB family transcription factor n=1 Tax=Rhizobium sp. ARZ01 TaxID=2769313 RepID=UPI00177BE427|nr:metalloregulator ArsR/SmtB family transcription factor [Rhizobium sp. ARZ01]MBD9374861.1 winged helix-turn-helix transcriptional regulator [Rhizobium sp. ARZ01]
MKQFMKPEADVGASFDLFFNQAKKASRFLKALSHETRLLILCLLTEGEKTVGEIETILRLPQAVVSQQLARLRQDQIVVTRRDGRQVFYSLADENVSAIMGTLYDVFCRPLMAREQGV